MKEREGRAVSGRAKRRPFSFFYPKGERRRIGARKKRKGARVQAISQGRRIQSPLQRRGRGKKAYLLIRKKRTHRQLFGEANQDELEAIISLAGEEKKKKATTVKKSLTVERRA